MTEMNIILELLITGLLSDLCLVN